MLVKLFDQSHEADLEEAINSFIDNDKIEVIDIKYQIAIMYDNKEQIYCYTAMVVYKKK